jgi:hypothetical protein
MLWSGFLLKRARSRFSVSSAVTGISEASGENAIGVLAVRQHVPSRCRAIALT